MTRGLLLGRVDSNALEIQNTFQLLTDENPGLVLREREREREREYSFICMKTTESPAWSEWFFQNSYMVTICADKHFIFPGNEMEDLLLPQRVGCSNMACHHVFVNHVIWRAGSLNQWRQLFTLL